MRAELRVALSACALAIVSLAPRSAGAFCRTTTVPVPASFQPQGSSCFTQGEPLYHPSQCVGYKIATASAGAISAKIVSASFARAFATWTAPNTRCLPGITPVQVGTVDGPVQVGYTAGAPAENANVVGFVGGAWTHDASGSTLALTTLTFRAEDGRILDADTEISRDVKWSVERPLGPDDYDFDTAILHETGHFLGLAHSATQDAAMYAAYAPGTSRAKLDDDDVLGVCAVYPTREARATKTGEVASTSCLLASDATSGSSCGEPTLVHGCAVGAASSVGAGDGVGWSVALAFSLTGLVFARRKRDVRGGSSR